MSSLTMQPRRGLHHGQLNQLPGTNFTHDNSSSRALIPRNTFLDVVSELFLGAPSP